eukprot:5224985-Prymnesium_polylepis.2
MRDGPHQQHHSSTAPRSTLHGRPEPSADAQFRMGGHRGPCCDLRAPSTVHRARRPYKAS